MSDDPVLHRQTWDAIPWLINGTASATERASAEAHLSTCADCRDEYALQSRIHAGIVADIDADEDADPRPALRRLLDRIEHADEDAIVAEPRASRPFGGTRTATRFGITRRRTLVAVVVAQSLALAVLGVGLLRERAPEAHADDARFETLSRAEAPTAAATIRFVPAPGLTMGELRAMLDDARLQIVESRVGSSIYGLAPAPANTGDTAASMALLRSRAGVLLVEPIGAVASRAP